jgi:hypothetical protein
MNQPNVVQYLPPQYNVESTLTAEVSADGANTFDFPLTDREGGK